MKWLHKIFDFYIDASIHVALAVVSFLFITGIVLNISIPQKLVFFVFFATLSCYNIIKDGRLIIYPRQKLSGQKLAIHRLSGFSLLAAAYFCYFLPIRIWLVLIVLLVLILLYMFPVFQRQKNLRSLGILKVILVSVIWTCVTVILPLLYNSIDWNWDYQVLSLQRFLLIIALIIPFEIRDMHLDPSGIRTIPRRIGVKKTKQLGVLLVFLANVLVYLRDDIYEFEIISRFLMLVISSLVILRTPSYPSKYYASFWVEALPVLWFGVLYLISS